MVKHLFLCLFLLSVVSRGQNKNIESRQNELTRLRSEINKLETEMKRKSQREKKTYELLDQYNRKTHLISRLINTLQEEEEQKNLHIENNEALLRALESQSASLKNIYGRFVTDVFKQMNRSPWSMITDTSYLITTRLQRKILHSLSSKSKVEVKRLDSVKIRTLVIQAELVKTRIEKENILKDKIGEEKYLSAQLKEKQSLLNKIKKDKNSIAQEIESKKQAEQKIHSLIAKLVEQARKRAEEALAAETRRKRDAEKRRKEQKITSPVDVVKNEAEIP
ncbi:MAG: hypothetical protein HYV28_19755, partial [Ignavibacteriales bacterium]|nr:hypothetical protein [Ignavibacteriales bacterium]